MLGEPQLAEAAATQAIAITEEHGIRLWRDMARIVLGSARAQLGRAGEGISLIRNGLACMAEVGARVNITEFLRRLAEAQALDGMIDDAIGTIEEALHANPQELVYRPHALTCRGQLRLKISKAHLAEAGFREAITLAQKMRAKAWELRATTSFARLLYDTNRRNKARAMLGEIYGWFTEGFRHG